ncbi:MAG: hypothetical protein LC776_00740 [Acidobacteria bacterium]|nr:hypothetical protein [Acidobacteriota bacterium]
MDHSRLTERLSDMILRNKHGRSTHFPEREVKRRREEVEVYGCRTPKEIYREWRGIMVMLSVLGYIVLLLISLFFPGMTEIVLKFCTPVIIAALAVHNGDMKKRKRE